MSAPLLWMILPGAAAGGMLFLGRWRRVIYIVGVGVCLWAAWMALILPIEQPLNIGNFDFKVAEGLRVLGRDFIITNEDRPFLSMLYGILAVWVVGSFFANVGKWFVPFSLGIVALLVGAISVEPFLYAALLIEIAVLATVPLLSSTDHPIGTGVFRFLVFQTIGMPFILFSGWMLAGAEVGSTTVDLIVRAGVILGIGFAFLMAVLPFHSWIPMLAEEIEPYIAGFIFYIFPGMVSLFGLSFFERFVWLQDSEVVLGIVRNIGIVMVAWGGLWAAASRHLGKIFSYNVVVEIGFSLMAISLVSANGVVIFFWMFFARAFPYIGWTVALSHLSQRQSGNLGLDAIQGIGYRRPVISALLLVSQIALAGLPMLAVFPARLALYHHLSGPYPVAVLGGLLGMAGLLIAAGRTLLTLFYQEEEEDAGQDGKKELPDTQKIDPIYRQSRVMAYLGLLGVILVLVGIGIFPQSFVPFISRMIEMFSQLAG